MTTKDTIYLEPMTGLQLGASISIIVDGAHLYAISREIFNEEEGGKRIDLAKFFKWFQQRFDVKSVHYSTTVSVDEGDSGLYRMLDWLEYSGHQTITEEFSPDDNDRNRARNTLMQRMTITALHQLRVGEPECLVLIAGESQLIPLVEYVRTVLCKRVLLLSYRDGERKMVADSLRRSCNHFADARKLLTEYGLFTKS